MENEIVSRWNGVVEDGDTTYIVGDFCWEKERYWPAVLKKLNGSKVLIRGNHDPKEFSRATRNLLSDIKDYKEIDDDGRKVIMCHYPILFYKSAWNPYNYMICGHVHTTRENEFLEAWREEMRASRSQRGDSCAQIYNVGCMLPYMDYTPRTLDEIIAAHS